MGNVIHIVLPEVTFGGCLCLFSKGPETLGKAQWLISVKLSKEKTLGLVFNPWSLRCLYTPKSEHLGPQLGESSAHWGTLKLR